MVHIRTLMDKVAENIEIDEGRMKDIFTANQEGKSAKEIAKALKLPLGTVKKILGEDKEEINEFTDSQLDVLARQYAGLKGKTISVDQANKLRQIFNRIPDRSLDALRRKKIPFLSGLALSRMVQKGMPVRSESLDEKKSAFRLSYSDRFGKHAGFEDAETLADLQNKAANLRKKGFKIDKMGRNTSPIKEEDEPQSNDQVKSLKVKLDKEKDTDALEKQLTAAQGQINILKQKLENEKNKVVKPEPNRETGEVPLTIGVAHKYLKDKQEKEMKKEEVDNYPTSDINKKKHAAYKDPKSGERKPVYTHEGAKLVYETIKGLKNKAEKSGMPYSILKKVYDRGMAAWRGGHRPGTSQQQWAFARVNSFVTKSSGTWGGADKDLAKQVRGSKK